VKIGKVEHVKVFVVNLILEVILGWDLVRLRPVGLPATTDLESWVELKSYIFLVATGFARSHISNGIADEKVVDIVGKLALERVNAVLAIPLLVSINPAVVSKEISPDVAQVVIFC